MMFLVSSNSNNHHLSDISHNFNRASLIFFPFNLHQYILSEERVCMKIEVGFALKRKLVFFDSSLRKELPKDLVEF